VEQIERNDPASVRVLTSWAGPPSDAPPEIRDLLQHPDLAITLTENERIARAHVEVFGSDEVTYRFQQFGRNGDLKVIEGLPEVAASPAASAALSRRNTILGAATWLPLLAGGSVVGLFASRHTFYAHSLMTPLLTALVLLAAFSVRSLTRELAPPSARRRVKG
jgi:hypothetical protein